jgi:hypothetical protein
MEHCLNDIRVKVKYAKKKVTACLFVHNKSHVDQLGIEGRPSRLEDKNNCMSNGKLIGEKYIIENDMIRVQNIKYIFR